MVCHGIWLNRSKEASLCGCIYHISIWVFPKIGVSQNGWFIMVPNPIKMDDLGNPPLFLG